MLLPFLRLSRIVFVQMTQKYENSDTYSELHPILLERTFTLEKAIDGKESLTGARKERNTYSLLILIVSLRSCSRAARALTSRLLLLFQMRGIDAQDGFCSFQAKRYFGWTLADIRLKAVPKDG